MLNVLIILMTWATELAALSFILWLVATIIARNTTWRLPLWRVDKTKRAAPVPYHLKRAIVLGVPLLLGLAGFLLVMIAPFEGTIKTVGSWYIEDTWYYRLEVGLGVFFMLWFPTYLILPTIKKPD